MSSRAGSGPGAAPAGVVAGEPVDEVRITARAENLKIVRRVVTRAARTVGCGEAAIRDIVIAVDEACQNVIRHAYRGDPDGEIVVDIRREGDRIAFNVVDFAAPVDADAIKPRDLDDLRPGGLGTHFINECMDEAGFRAPPEGAGNRLWMVKRIE